MTPITPVSGLTVPNMSKKQERLRKNRGGLQRSQELLRDMLCDELKRKAGSKPLNEILTMELLAKAATFEELLGNYNVDVSKFNEELELAFMEKYMSVGVSGAGAGAGAGAGSDGWDADLKERIGDCIRQNAQLGDLFWKMGVTPSDKILGEMREIGSRADREHDHEYLELLVSVRDGLMAELSGILSPVSVEAKDLKYREMLELMLSHLEEQISQQGLAMPATPSGDGPEALVKTLSAYMRTLRQAEIDGLTGKLADAQYALKGAHATSANLRSKFDAAVKYTDNIEKQLQDMPRLRHKVTSLEHALQEAQRQVVAVSRAAEDGVRSEYDTRIERLTSRLAEAQSELTATTTALSELEKAKQSAIENVLLGRDARIAVLEAKQAEVLRIKDDELKGLMKDLAALKPVLQAAQDGQRRAESALEAVQTAADERASAAESSASKAEDQLVTVRAALEKAETDRGTYEGARDQAREAIAGLRTELEAAKANAASFEQDAGRAREEVSEARAAAEKAVVEAQEAARQLDAIQADKDSTTQALTLAKERSDTAATSEARIRSELETQTARMTTLQTDLETARAEAVAATARAETSEAGVTTARAEVEVANTAVTKANEAREAAEAATSAANAALERVQSELTTARTERQQAAEANSDLRTENARLQAVLTERESEYTNTLSRHESENEGLSQQVSELQTQVRAAEAVGSVRSLRLEFETEMARNVQAQQWLKQQLEEAQSENQNLTTQVQQLTDSNTQSQHEAEDANGENRTLRHRLEEATAASARAQQPAQAEIEALRSELAAADERARKAWRVVARYRAAEQNKDNTPDTVDIHTNPNYLKEVATSRYFWGPALAGAAALTTGLVLGAAAATGIGAALLGVAAIVCIEIFRYTRPAKLIQQGEKVAQAKVRQRRRTRKGSRKRVGPKVMANSSSKRQTCSSELVVRQDSASSFDSADVKTAFETPRKVQPSSPSSHCRGAGIGAGGGSRR